MMRVSASCAFIAGAGLSALVSRVGGARGFIRYARAVASGSPGPEPPCPAKKVKAALCQLKVTSDKNVNIIEAKNAIQEAANNGAELVVLPEMWNCPYSNASFPIYAEDFSSGASPSTAMMSEMARSCRVTLVGGTVPERRGEKLYNTCCVFGTDGELLAKYSKSHLFDIDIPGKITFFESETLTPGELPTVVDTACGRLGIGVCYDIRFPELAMIYAQRGAQLLVYPGAFNMTTGPLHWQLLSQARAVDNQLYVAVCSPARDESAGYVAWGHSTVVGPFAEIVATTEHEPTILYADMDYSQLEERRRNMPLQNQRRRDMYALVDKTKQ